MKKMSKFYKIGLTILVIVILLFFGGAVLLQIYVNSLLDFSLPTREPLPNNVEVIVADEGFSDWELSPEGDRIIYETNDTFLLFPATQQKQSLSNCRIQTWLDNDIIFCNDRFLIEINNETGELMTVSVHKVNASEVDLETMLQQTGSIYNFRGNSDLSHALLLQNVVNLPDPNKHYLVTNIKNIEVVSQTYSTTPLPLSWWSDSLKKTFSPNGLYYYEYSRGQSLTIFSAKTNNKVSEFVEDSTVYFRFGGWAADNSGVYFEMDSRMMLVDPTHLNQLLKLKVPE